MILAKSCHDMDLLGLAHQPAMFGGFLASAALTQFTAAHAPHGRARALHRWLSRGGNQCPYDAHRYAQPEGRRWLGDGL